MDQSEIDALLAGGGKPPKKPKAAAKAPVAEPMPAPSAASVQAEPHKDGSGHVISELDTVTSVTERESNKVMDQLDQISQLVARQQQLVTDMMRHEGAQSPGAQKAIHEVMSASKEIQDKVFEAMDLMQFQDITRQQIEQVLKALDKLDEHCEILSRRILAAEGENFKYIPLNEHLNDLYSSYVMETQRASHQQSLHQPASAFGGGKAPAASAKIELF